MLCHVAMEKRIEKVSRIVKRMSLERERQERSKKWNSSNDEYALPRRNKSFTLKEERRSKERLLKAEMRKSVPSLAFIVRRLDEQNLLPAIFFIFSRAGCDKAAQMMSKELMVPKNRINSFDNNDEEDGLELKKVRSDRSSRNRGVIKDAKGRSFRTNRGRNIREDEDENLDILQYVSGNIYQNENIRKFSRYGLLRNETIIAEVADRITLFNMENPEIPFSEGEAGI